MEFPPDRKLAPLAPPSPQGRVELNAAPFALPDSSAAPRRAVGVAYGVGGPLPAVVVKAAGNDANAVVNAAEAADIPIVRDERLVEQLYRLPLDAPIGRELFPVMAALIAHVLIADRSDPFSKEILR